jgi:16S rRNA (uracil1498-N3)-methyltransferase
VLPRFFVPGHHAAEHLIELPEDEAAHLTRVLRLSPGDAIRIFDGLGREWHATVGEAGKQRVTARIEHEVVPLAEPGVAITLGLAVLKGDKMDAVVRDAVMLGAIAIQPVLTERTEVAATVIERGGRVARWQRIAVSSAKQCGRAVIPAVRNAIRFTEALAAATNMESEGFSPARPVVLLVEPQAGDGARSLGDLPRSQALFLLVGPEGGWTAGEVQQARAAGAMLVTLGTQVLRADAAPMVAMTAVRVAFGDF